MKINLINWRFWSFQWQSCWFKGFSYNQILPTNEFFLYSLQNYYLSSKYIDIITWYLKWKLKKGGTYRFIYSCDFPLTKKPTEMWMGKGKGSITDWAIPIKKGLIFFKLKLKNPILISSIMWVIKSKLPFSVKYSYSNHTISELTPKSFNCNIKNLPIFESKLCKKWFITELN